MLSQVKIRNDELAILTYFSSFHQPHKAVVECTMNWYWLADLLNNHGFPCLLAHAKYLKAISYAKVKTDKVDSLTLAKYNIRLPSKPPLNHPQSFEFLCQLDLPEPAQLGISLHLQNIRLLNHQIQLLEKTIKSQLRPTPEIQLLLSIPGIGEIAATTILLETGGMERFPDAKHFLSYCRLVPGSTDSGGKRRAKGSNKDGNRYLKYIFTESALKAIVCYPEIKQFYHRKLRKANPPIARTIVAKELAKIVYYVLSRREPFKAFKGITVEKSKSWPRLASPCA